jgi:hypothetical protein
MHVVRMRIDTTEADAQAFSVQIDGKRGEAWAVERVIDGMTGSSAAELTIELRGDQRLVITPKVKKTRWSKEQMANVAVDADEDKAMTEKEVPKGPKNLTPSDARPKPTPQPVGQPVPQPPQGVQGKPGAAGPGLHNPMKGTKD